MIELSKKSYCDPINVPFFQLSDDAVLSVLDHLMKNSKISALSDCKALLCTHHSMEQILDPWWSYLLPRYFPYSFVDPQPEFFGKEPLIRLARMEDNIRNRGCLYETINLVYICYPRLIDDIESNLRETQALTIYDGRLFHVGFGDRADFKQISTTVDIHYYNDGFDLKKADRSIRFERGDIVSTFVREDYVYLGSSNGDIVIVNYKESRVVATIRCNSCLISAICVYKGRICYSDYENKSLIICHSFGGKMDTKFIKFNHTIVGLESDEKNFYCITSDGNVATVDVKKGTVTRLQSLGMPIGGKPLLKSGLLYTFHNQSLYVFNLTEDKIQYSHRFEGQVSGLGVYGEYAFIGILDIGIIALDRITGVYVSKICDFESCKITGVFHFYKDVLYAYTADGEILTVDLSRPGLSRFEKQLRLVAREASLAFRPVVALTGPNRCFL